MEETTTPSLYKRDSQVAPIRFEVYPKWQRGPRATPPGQCSADREPTYADFLSPWQAPLKWLPEVSYEALLEES